MTAITDLVRRRMADGRTIHDGHVRDLLTEIERLRDENTALKEAQDDRIATEQFHLAGHEGWR